MSETSVEEALNQKQKKERKELQAQIQILKKSTCKGDKKKKKEVLEEIARLESDLDQRHSEETATLKLRQLTVTELPDNEVVKLPNNESPEPIQTRRTSKAQKRRDKKATAERERDQRIKEEEALNIFGKRHIETEAIKKILRQRNLMIYEVPSDGHCLYNAIAHQLKKSNQIPLGCHDLRLKTASYLRENIDEFLPFLTNSDPNEPYSPLQYAQYCDNVASTSAWGGDIELQVLSRVLERRIEVIQATGSPYIIGAHGQKITVTFHRHMYELGAHYNSVTPLIEVDNL